MNTKLLLVDDHPMLRTGLRELATRVPNLTLVGEASTGESALQLAETARPDLVIMDIHLPDISGIETTRRIVQLLPQVKVIVFSSDPARRLVDEALQAGACGYIFKQSAVEELIQAIQTVMMGKLFFSRELSAGILEDYRKTLLGASEPSKLLVSERERQILRLIAAGRRSKEIATELKLSPKSIETYRARLTKKLGCSSTAELVRYAIREGIVEA